MSREQVLDRLHDITRSLPRETLFHSHLLPVENATSAPDTLVDSDAVAKLLESDDDNVDVKVVPMTPKAQLDEAFKLVEKVSHIHDVKSSYR